MKTENDFISLLRELLVTQMNHWTFFPFYVMFVVIMSDVNGTGTPIMLLWLAIGCMPFLLYLVRTRIQKFWLIALLHFAAASVMFFVPTQHVTVKVFHVMVGFIYVILSCYLWAKGREKLNPKIYPLIPVGLSVLMMYMLHHQNHFEWDSALLNCLILVLGIYFIVYYIEQYQNFLVVNSSSAGHIPAKEMFRSGMGLTCGYTCIGFMILILISNVDWLGAVLNMLKSIISFIVRGIQALFPPQEGDMPEVAEMSEATDMGGMAAMEGGEGFWLWDVLEYVMIVILFVFAAFVLIKGIIALVKFIQSKLGSLNTESQDNIEGQVSDVHEKCEIVRSDDWKLNIPFLALNPKDRIRSLYKKRILASQSTFTQGQENSALECYTARESGKVLECDEMALIYEKARYSNHECNGDDVKRMRNACR